MKIARLIGLFCALVSSDLARSNNLDTTKTYQLGEIIITATRSPIFLSDSPSPVDVVTLSQIQNDE